MTRGTETDAIGFTMTMHDPADFGVRLIETTEHDSNGATVASYALHCNGERHRVGLFLYGRLAGLGFDVNVDQQCWIEAVLVLRLLQYCPSLNTNDALVNRFLRDQVLHDTDASQAVVAIAGAIVPRLLAPNVGWDGSTDPNKLDELRPYADAALPIIMAWYAGSEWTSITSARREGAPRGGQDGNEREAESGNVEEGPTRPA